MIEDSSSELAFAYNGLTSINVQLMLDVKRREMRKSVFALIIASSIVTQIYCQAPEAIEDVHIVFYPGDWEPSAVLSSGSLSVYKSSIITKEISNVPVAFWFWYYFSKPDMQLFVRVSAYGNARINLIDLTLYGHNGTITKLNLSRPRIAVERPEIEFATSLPLEQVTAYERIAFNGTITVPEVF